MKRAVVWAIWAYVVAVLATWSLLYFGGDRWWFATLMLFGPRWIYGLPLVVLIPAVLFVRRPFWALALSILILVGPIMGCRVPWKRLASTGESDIRILALNVADESVSSADLAMLIERTDPDIVALQEWPADFAFEWPVGWHIQGHAKLITASRYPLGPVDATQPESSRKFALASMVETPTRRFCFVNIHLSTPRYGLQAVLDPQTLIDPSDSPKLQNTIRQRRQESRRIGEWISQFSNQVIIAGDFNMPVDSDIYRRTWSNYDNAFSAAGFGFGYGKTSSIFGWQYGSRIDHILSGSNWRPCRCWIEADLGSDHLPQIADLSYQDP